MKYKAHQTFFLRKGWLSKGMKAIEKDPSIFMPSKSRQAMDELGLGSNQVVALRYWLIAMGLIKKSRNGKAHDMLPLFKLIRERDPYIDEIGTLWVLHYNLACNKDDATSWYWLFNECKAKSFTKQTLAEGIKNFDDLCNINNISNKRSTAMSSIESDVDCIMKTYITSERLTGKTVSPESVVDCPLGDLGILDIVDRQSKTYRKKPPTTSSLPALLVLYAIQSMLVIGCTNSSELLIEDLLSGHYSPGLLFNLDSTALLPKLYELEDGNYLRINRTAGSDTVRVDDPKANPIKYLQEYYSLLG